MFSDVASEHGPDTLFNSYSMAKSLVGVLTLVALSDGTIPGLDTSVGELLDMRSGLAFEKDPGQVGGAGADGKSEQALNYGPFSDMARLHVEGLDSVMGDVQLVAAGRGRRVPLAAVLVVADGRGQPLPTSSRLLRESPQVGPARSANQVVTGRAAAKLVEPWPP